MVQFVAQIAHAARVLLFQPFLLHALQVMHVVISLPADTVPGSMRDAMAYPSEGATDGYRVEWLQLNLLLQFQTVYKMALCQPSIYQPQYSPGEQQLLQAFLRLEEIYTHLIGRFPHCCPLSDQEQAVLAELCRKLNKFFVDGKQIKNVLDAQPENGKMLLVNNRIGGVTSAQYAIRDWILPFMMHFTDLLKVLWTLLTQLKRKQHHSATQRVGIEGVARQVGRCIIEQLSEEEAALRIASRRPAESLITAELAISHNATGSGGVDAGDGSFTQRSASNAAPIGTSMVSGSSSSVPRLGDGGGQGWASVVRRPAPEPAGNVSVERSKSGSQIAVASAAKPRTAATSEEGVRALVAKREAARCARDFESADRLREQLARLGVTLDDQNKTWRMNDGRSGAIIPVNVSELNAQKAAKSGAAALTDEEIDRFVKEREQARFTSDYKTADRIRDMLEKHGVQLDTKEGKWQTADGRSGSIGPVNISAAHAQKAARSGAPKLAIEEIERILVQREQARARRDYKTADLHRDTLEKHGVYLDAKENKWHATDGRNGAIVMSSLSDDEVGKILAARQAAREWFAFLSVSPTLGSRHRKITPSVGELLTQFTFCVLLCRSAP